MRESKNAQQRECKGKIRNMRQSEGKCETVHKEKHKKPSVSTASTSTRRRAQAHPKESSTMNLSDDRFI